MSWGVFPLYFTAFGLGVERIGILKAIYPIVWGVGQTITGPLSDRWGRKGLIVAGMWVQALGLFVTGVTGHFVWWFAGSVLLGVGTAMVYPSLIAAVSDASHPSWRARSLSVYRFWRDLWLCDRGPSPPASLRIGSALPPRSLLSRGSHFLPGAVVAIGMRKRQSRCYEA